MKQTLKSLWFIGICFLGINLLVACGSHKKKNQAKTKSKTTTTTNNSISSKQDTSTRMKKKKTVKPVKENYSPGTVGIKARIIMYDETSPYRVAIKVLSVYGYGSSTPHIADNSDLKVDISKALTNKYSLDDIKKEFTSVKPINVVLRSNRGMAMGKQTGPNWTIIDFH